jgi:hypothetical protein
MKNESQNLKENYVHEVSSSHSSNSNEYCAIKFMP